MPQPTGRPARRAPRQRVAGCATVSVRPSPGGAAGRRLIAAGAGRRGAPRACVVVRASRQLPELRGVRLRDERDDLRARSAAAQRPASDVGAPLRPRLREGRRGRLGCARRRARARGSRSASACDGRERCRVAQLAAARSTSSSWLVARFRLSSSTAPRRASARRAGSRAARVALVVECAQPRARAALLRDARAATRDPELLRNAGPLGAQRRCLHAASVPSRDCAAASCCRASRGRAPPRATSAASAASCARRRRGLRGVGAARRREPSRTSDRDAATANSADAACVPARARGGPYHSRSRRRSATQRRNHQFWREFCSMPIDVVRTPC